jgi:hypothetical protein
MLLLSQLVRGGAPQSFERSIWDCVGFYMIHTFLDPLVESQFRIISQSYNFLFGTTTTQSFTFSTSHFFSGQSWHASSSSIMLYLWLGARRPTAVPHNSPPNEFNPKIFKHNLDQTLGEDIRYLFDSVNLQ